MHFDTENPIVRLCAEGMSAEGEGASERAADLFMQAWNESSTDFEKSIAAHYVARHQENLTSQLHWNETALQHALKSNDAGRNGMLPSLYLNVGKDHEDLNNVAAARKHYESAEQYVRDLPADGYGELIARGIRNALERLKNSRND